MRRPALELDATYFDAADPGCWPPGVTVRRRTGEGTRWTVKLPADVRGRAVGSRRPACRPGVARREIDWLDDRAWPSRRPRSSDLVAPGWVTPTLVAGGPAGLASPPGGAGPRPAPVSPLAEVDDDLVSVCRVGSSREVGRFREIEVELGRGADGAGGAGARPWSTGWWPPGARPGRRRVRSWPGRSSLVGRADEHPRRIVRAAGGVVCRDGAGGTIEMLVVHRPRYDDWSAAQGQVRRGRARRGRRAARGARGDRPAVPARARSWSARATSTAGAGPRSCATGPMTVEGGSFEANDEVDEVRWLPVDDAVDPGSRDHPVLRSFQDRRSRSLPGCRLGDGARRRRPRLDGRRAGGDPTTCRPPRFSAAVHLSFIPVSLGVHRGSYRDRGRRRTTVPIPADASKESTLLSLTRRGSIAAAGLLAVIALLAAACGSSSKSRPAPRHHRHQRTRLELRLLRASRAP